MSSIAELAMLVNDDFSKPLNKQIFDEFILVASDDVVKVLNRGFAIGSREYEEEASFIPKKDGTLRIKVVMDTIAQSSSPAVIRCKNESGEILATISPTEKAIDYVADINVEKNNVYVIEVKRTATGIVLDRVETLSICGNVRFGRVIE